MGGHEDTFPHAAGHAAGCLAFCGKVGPPAHARRLESDPHRARPEGRPRPLRGTSCTGPAGLGAGLRTQADPVTLSQGSLLTEIC